MIFCDACEDWFHRNLLLLLLLLFDQNTFINFICWWFTNYFQSKRY